MVEAGLAGQVVGREAAGGEGEAAAVAKAAGGEEKAEEEGRAVGEEQAEIELPAAAAEKTGKMGAEEAQVWKPAESFVEKNFAVWLNLL